MVIRGLQNSANNKNVSAPMTWDALNRALGAYGAPDIDFERFSQLYDSDPVIQSMIDNFDEHGIQIKTSAGDQQGMQPQQGGAPGKPMMAAAEKRAAANFGK